MTKPRFPVSTTRRAYLKVRGHEPTSNSRDTKRGVKALKNRDRVTKKTPQEKK